MFQELISDIFMWILPLRPILWQWGLELNDGKINMNREICLYVLTDVRVLCEFPVFLRSPHIPQNETKTPWPMVTRSPVQFFCLPDARAAT